MVALDDGTHPLLGDVGLQGCGGLVVVGPAVVEVLACDRFEAPLRERQCAARLLFQLDGRDADWDRARFVIRVCFVFGTAWHRFAR